MRTVSSIRFISSCLAVLLLALGSTPVTYAHRVTVFAWVDGGIVHTTSQFSKERKVHGGVIEVFDPATGERLLSGKTNDQGEFSFTIPETARARGSDLRVALKAGEGHAGEWTIPAAEYMSQAGASQADAQPAEAGQAKPVSEAASSDQTALPDVQPDQTSVSISEQALERAVDRALERRLQPVMRLLAEQVQAGPSFIEIVGGMGWLVGLAGMGAWLSARKKK